MLTQDTNWYNLLSQYSGVSQLFDTKIPYATHHSVHEAGRAYERGVRVEPLSIGHRCLPGVIPLQFHIGVRQDQLKCWTLLGWIAQLQSLRWIDFGWKVPCHIVHMLRQNFCTCHIFKGESEARHYQLEALFPRPDCQTCDYGVQPHGQDHGDIVTVEVVSWLDIQKNCCNKL